MIPLNEREGSPQPGISEIALAVVDHIPAMVAYWDRTETCRFANQAYKEWFGRSRSSLLGTQMRDLLGPLYELNLPHIRGVLRGEVQVFEREIPLPDGSGCRQSIATYTPDRVDGEVRGFFVHVADATLLKQQQRELTRALLERDRALAEVRTLRGLLPVCASCKNIRNE
ncbi:MAG TPA: PAS domain-containing protein, partial [Gemmatimonadales bacterium]|nr:PAS domain-containing protein [Gemmatimonadales bacterium]